MNLDIRSLIVGPCCYCGCAVTEADSWGPAVHTLDAYPPKTTAVYHCKCRSAFAEDAYDRKYHLNGK